MMRNCLLLFALLVAPIHAKRSKWECATSGNIETCNLYINPNSFSVSAIAAANSQQQANWCWLASIEMAFRYYGYSVPQQKLLELLWGNIEDMPGRAEQIIGATNRVYTDDSGKRFRAESIEVGSWLEASVALSRDIPVLVGYAQPGGIGHMTMVVGIQMQALYNNVGQVVDSRVSDVVLWDPWPGVGLRPMSQVEFDSTFLLVAVGATALDPVSIARRTVSPPVQSLRYFNLLGRVIR